MSDGRLEVSVVIPSHNRRETLRRCLESLAEQTQDPATFEVIVCDDGSTDGTAAMAESLDVPFGLRVIRLDQGGWASAQNAGVRAAGAPVCLHLDDDVVADPGLIAAHAVAHRDSRRLVGIGRLLQAVPPDRDRHAQAFARIWNLRYDDLAERDADWADCYGANMSTRRDAVIGAGGFDPGLEAAGDIDLGYRLVEAGCEIRYLAGAVAVHHDDKPGPGLLAKESHFGRICVQFAETRPGVRRRLLTWFNEPSAREVTLRRLFLALRVPPVFLARLDSLVPGEERRYIWSSFAFRYAFWHGVRSGVTRRGWLRTTRGVPVLMYHAFTDADQGGRFVMPRRSFVRQMRLLRAVGYRVIAFEELARLLREGEPLPRRAVAITLDDGYRDNLEVAAPVLRRRGIPATLFLVSSKLGERSDWDGDSSVRDRPLLSAEEARRLREHGVRPGAHTRTHPRLLGLPEEDLDREVGGSRRELEGALGEDVAVFAYPYGLHNAAAVAAAERGRFVGACTAEARIALQGDDPLRIPRIEVKGPDGMMRFLRKVWFGGD